MHLKDAAPELAEATPAQALHTQAATAVAKPDTVMDHHVILVSRVIPATAEKPNEAVNRTSVIRATATVTTIECVLCSPKLLKTPMVLTNLGHGGTLRHAIIRLETKGFRTTYSVG